MIRPELYKIRHHRTPRVLAATFAFAVLAVPAWLLVRAPESPDQYLEGVTAVFAVGGALVAPVFGSWLVGHEYRQGTLRRVVAIDARRSRLLAAKAVVGLSVLVAALAAIAGIAVGASAGAAAIHEDTLVTDGVTRDLLSGGFIAVVSGAVAYALSVILKSDTYAILATLAVMVIFGPLVAHTPIIGHYTPYAISSDIGSWIAQDGESARLTIGAAAAALSATLTAAGAAATAAFQHRDI